MERLIDGYRRFRRTRWPEQRDLFEKLAEGQNPRLLVIACCDSRVDPASIFQVSPGELFVVRNVANLVPPFNQGPGLHGTAAAIEFAVNHLRVSTILVLGHGRCGGIAAALDHSIAERTHFIHQWANLLEPAVERCSQVEGDRAAAVERAAICLSIERLKEYPFVAERLAAGDMGLEGAIFDVATGVLEILDMETGEFQPVEAT